MLVYLDSGIGACLKDDAEDAEGHSDPLHREARVELAVDLDLIDGVGELHQVPHPRDGVLDLGGAKLEPRLEGSGNLGAGDGSLVAVDLIGRLNGRDAVLKRCSDELERLRDGGAACERRAVSQFDAADRHWEGHMWPPQPRQGVGLFDRGGLGGELTLLRSSTGRAARRRPLSRAFLPTSHTASMPGEGPAEAMQRIAPAACTAAILGRARRAAQGESETVASVGRHGQIDSI